MEDILSSIKRIIAEESDTLPGRAKRSDRAVPRRPEGDATVRDDILELREAVQAAMPDQIARRTDAPVAGPAETAAATPPTSLPPTSLPPTPPPAPVAPPVPETPNILSQRTAAASRGPLDTLSRLIVKPEVAGSDTLEAMVREMLRPMLREWLDAHLPQMVEAMVAKEIDRITGK
ncbi:MULTISPECIES: DUF2497 domain-containing protein [Sphingomonas]|uniref:DUF2497 domain-containing protein n=1 Tax=Sphingomonas TaxID=13687 RepID=UPI0024136422|nr:DUF2497 domain-containing protein [Sphingomonas echinoides]